jgi:hypothetical protein
VLELHVAIDQLDNGVGLECDSQCLGSPVEGLAGQNANLLQRPVEDMSPKAFADSSV